MPAVEMHQDDLEQGGYRRCVAGSDVSGDVSLCFSDGEEGSCDSEFLSTAGGSYDEQRFVTESERDGCVKVEIGNGVGEVRERDCRICHLGLKSESDESGIAIELGCSCKEDLAAAHMHCAEAWFRIKGNTTCEICNSIARNVNINGGDEVVDTVQNNDSTNAASTATVAAAGGGQSIWQGRRVLNLLLACMVFAFVISWLFHFNVPS